MNVSSLKILLNIFPRRTVIISILISLAMVVLDYIGIAMILPLIKIVADPGVIERSFILSGFRSLLQLKNNEGVLVATCVVVTLIYIAKTISVYYINRKNAMLTQMAGASLAKRLCEMLLHVKYKIIVERGASPLVNSISTYSVHSVIALQSLIVILNESMMILVLLLMSLFINIKVTIAMTLFLLSLAIIFKFMLLDRMNSLGRKRINIEGRWFRLVFSILSAMKDIRIMGLEDNICKQHDSLVKDNARISAEFLAMQATPRLTVELVFICVATFAMAGMVLLKMNIATYVATITMLAILFTRMIPSIHKLYNAINAYRYYELSVMALYDMHSLLASNQVIHSTSDIPLVFNYDITLNNVVCRYSNQPEPALKDISVRIIKESFVAVVGHSGSGKSTFLDLLSGLIEPESGEILIDGREVTKDNLGTIRSLMGYVPQKVTLIEGSIGYNIALDENYMNHRESINKAVQEAQIDSFINGLPEGMEYSVGETGSSMSGGQRQRIGIARALYKDPLILLLDEASSGLDPKTEKQFMDSIWKLRKSKTVIFATHKLDNIIDFDNIIVLDKGRMVDSGTHYELLSRCNIYIEMYWTASKS